MATPSLWLVSGDFDEVGRFDQTGSLLSSFDAGASGQEYIAHDANECLWMGEANESRYNKWARDSTPPGPSISTSNKDGIVADADNSIWAWTDASTVEKYNQSASFIQSITPPPHYDGLTRDTSGSLYTATGFGDSSITVFDESGSETRKIGIPISPFNAFYIGADGDNCLYMARPNDAGVIFKTDNTGALETSFSAGGYGSGDEGGGITTTDEPLGAAAQGPSIWISESDFTAGPCFYKVDQSGSQVSAFTPSGVTDYVYGAGYNRDTGNIWGTADGDGDTHAWEPSTGAGVKEKVTDAFVNFGVAVDVNRCLWLTTFDDTVVRYSQSMFAGAETSFAAPSAIGEAGIALNKSQSIWVASSGSAYRVNQTGSVASQFTASGIQGIGIDNNECLYTGLRFGNSSIFKRDQTGTVQSQFAGPAVETAGIGTTDEPLSAGGGGVTSVTDTAITSPFGVTTVQTSEFAIAGDTANKTSIGFSPMQSNELGAGIVQAVKAAFGFKSRLAQPAKVWFDTTEQWDSAQNFNTAHTGDVVSLQAGAQSGYIIPSQQNWEG